MASFVGAGPCPARRPAIGWDGKLDALVRLSLLPATLLAIHRVIHWYGTRVVDGSEEQFGWVALITFLYFALRDVTTTRTDLRLSFSRLVVSIVLLDAYLASVQWMPQLVSAVIGSTLLLVVMSSLGVRLNTFFARWGLLMLSLPMVSTAQFYLGYPLRISVAHCASFLLKVSGFAAGLQGTCLTFDGHIVGIDPACSGIKMLWTALFICFAMACMRNLSNRTSALLSILTVFMVLVGNVFRATSLFMLEVLPWGLPAETKHLMHEGVGLVVFGFLCLLMYLVVLLLERFGPKTVVSAERSSSVPAEPSPAVAAAQPNSARLWLALLYIAMCLASPLVGSPQPLEAAHSVGAVQSVRAPRAKREAPAAAPVLNVTLVRRLLNSETLEPLQLSEQELAFSAGFPGSLAKFREGGKQIIVRVVNKSTRQLHPSEDCFRAIGYQIEPLPCVVTEGNLWGRFSAQDGQTHLVVSERIFNDKGKSFADVSSWYWCALLHEQEQPWYAVSIADPVIPAK